MHRLLAPSALVAAVLVALATPTIANAATLSGSNADAVEVDDRTVERPITVAGAGTVQDVVVTIDFLKTDGSCAAPAGGNAFHSETAFALRSPAGTRVQLVAPGTYSGGTAIAPVSVAFDADAAQTVGGGAPVSGTYRPVGSLAAFEGQAAAGTWTLEVTDTVGSDPLCFREAELTVITGAPTLADTTLPAGIVGDAYSASIVVAEGDAPITYAAVDPADVPAGLVVNPDGTITGTPEISGDASFEVVATNAGGASEPATVTVRIDQRAALSGAATATAQIAVPFSYQPELEPGDPAATVTATGLPDGLVVDAATGAITGTPTGALGDVDVVLTADNGIAPPAVLEVRISVVAGPAVAIAIAPEASTVDAGAAQAFEVTGVDAEGNAADVSAAVLTSSDASDVVDGRTVTVGAAGTRTITATLGELADSATLEVVAAPVPSAPAPSASAPAPSAPAAAGPTLPQTGGEAAGWLVLVAGLMVAAGVLARRATRA